MLNTFMNAKVKERKTGGDQAIAVCTFLLTIYGILMVASASMGQALDSGKALADLLKAGVKESIFAVLGWLCLRWLQKHFSLGFLRSQAFPYLIIANELLLVSCRAFPSVSGAYAWIHLPGGFTIQPSEFVKIFGMFIVAAYCGDIKHVYKKDWAMLKQPLLILVIYIGTILIVQHDLGSAAVLTIIVAVDFLIPDHPNLKVWQRTLRILFWLLVAGVLFIISDQGASFIENLHIEEYQKARFVSAHNPFLDRYDTGYQLVNGLISFAEGGWFGRGYANSIRKYTDFPAATTDFILAILVEELGFVGFLVLMFLYAVIIVRLFQYAVKIHNERARILLVGTAMYYTVHIVFNIGGVTGLIPLTGVPLLLISSGGSSTLSILCATGICQSIIGSYQK